MPLLWLSLAFLAGIIIADNVALPTTTWLIFAGVSFGLAVVVFIFRRVKARRTFDQEAPSFLASSLSERTILLQKSSISAHKLALNCFQ